MDEEGNRHPDRVDASGISIPTVVVDEFLMMRLAQLLERGQMSDVIERMTAREYPRGGNFGMESFNRLAERIKSALKPLESGPPRELPPYDIKAHDPPYALLSSAERRSRTARLRSRPMAPLSAFVDDLRAETAYTTRFPI